MMNGAEKLVAGGIGTAAVAYAFTSHQFYAGAFGLGNRTKPIPKWFGRLWFVGVGLWFFAIALGIGIPLVLQRVICIGLGSFAIFSSVTKAPAIGTSTEMILGVPRSGYEKYAPLIGMLVGVFFIVGGILLK